jgi:hypothetical protein
MQPLLGSLVLLSIFQALVWESVGLMAGQLYTEVSVVFKNVQFHRATSIPKEGMYISIVIRVVCLEISCTCSFTRS